MIGIWLKRSRYWLISVCFLFFALTLRALWNWGDSGHIIIELEEGAPENFRWLNGIVLLDFLYGAVRPHVGARAILTYFGIVLGTISQPLLLNIVEKSLGNSRNAQSTLVYLWIASSFATWTLFSGYIEIYPLVQFSILLILWAFVTPIQSRAGDIISGAILGFAPSLYMGLLPLYPLGLLVARKRSRGFSIAWATGILAAAGLLPLNWGFSVSALLGLFSFHHVGPMSWYVGLDEIFNSVHIVQLLRALLIYDPFLPFIAIVGAVFMRTRYEPNFPYPVLFTYSLFYLSAFSVKRHVLGFADWDIFSWVVVLWNITFLHVIAQRVSYRVIVVRAAVLVATWYAFHRPSKEMDVLPQGARVNAINNRHPSRPIPDTDSMSEIRRDLIEKRNRRK